MIESKPNSEIEKIASEIENAVFKVKLYANELTTDQESFNSFTKYKTIYNLFIQKENYNQTNYDLIMLKIDRPIKDILNIIRDKQLIPDNEDYKHLANYRTFCNNWIYMREVWSDLNRTLRNIDDFSSISINTSIKPNDKIQWPKNPSHLGFILKQLVIKNYIELPPAISKDNKKQVAKYFLNFFEVKSDESFIKMYGDENQPTYATKEDLNKLLNNNKSD